MVVQLAEASGDRSEQGTDKQGRAGKQHRGRGRGREKRENAVAAVAGAGGEAPPVVPAAAQPPQLAATTAGARRRGRGAANSDSTALVVGVASLSLDSRCVRASDSRVAVRRN